MKTILALGSHFDDIEFGCGGTLIRHRDNGDEIYLAITHANDPRGGSTPEVRKLEQNKSSEILRVKKTILFDESWTTEYKVEILDKIKSDILYFQFENDFHQHHLETSKIGFAVSRRIQTKTLRYISQSSHSYYPNYLNVIDIEQKKKLVSVFKSQNGRQPKFMEIMEAQNRFFGSLIPGRDHYAEGFVLFREVNIL
jgi:LmbE family N-acetylglucosaminyl deacetylase